MKHILILVLILTFGCSSEAQKDINKSPKNKIELSNGIISTVNGINVEKYKITPEDFELPIKSITIEHVLCIVTEECDKEMLMEFIKEGVNLNVPTCDGDNPIFILADCEDVSMELIELMVKNGANIHAGDIENYSLLWHAIDLNNFELVDYLIEKGVDKNQRSSNPNMGCLPIHGCNSLEMIKKLDKEGFDLEVVCNNGLNLLHWAARNNYKEMAKYLVENEKIEINQKDVFGKTPLDYAKEKFHFDVIDIISEKK